MVPRFPAVFLPFLKRQGGTGGMRRFLAILFFSSFHKERREREDEIIRCSSCISCLFQGQEEKGNRRILCFIFDVLCDDLCFSSPGKEGTVSFSFRFCLQRKRKWNKMFDHDSLLLSSFL